MLTQKRMLGLSRCKDETIEVAGWSTVPLPLSWLMDDHNDITVRVACATNHAWSQPLFRPRGNRIHNISFQAPSPS